MNGHHPIHWRPEWNKIEKAGQILSPFLTSEVHLILLEIGAPDSRVFGLRLEIIPLIPLVLLPILSLWILVTIWRSLDVILSQHLQISVELDNIFILALGENSASLPSSIRRTVVYFLWSHKVLSWWKLIPFPRIGSCPSQIAISKLDQ